MGVDLTEEQAAYLVEVLGEAHKALLHEIHHADSGDYKDRLRETADMNEALAAKIKKATS